VGVRVSTSRPPHRELTQLRADPSPPHLWFRQSGKQLVLVSIFEVELMDFPACLAVGGPLCGVLRTPLEDPQMCLDRSSRLGIDLSHPQPAFDEGRAPHPRRSSGDGLRIGRNVIRICLIFMDF
jgi:hypothetical protein